MTLLDFFGHPSHLVSIGVILLPTSLMTPSTQKPKNCFILCLLSQPLNTYFMNDCYFSLVNSRAIWEDAGVADNRTMSFDEFKLQLVKHHGLAEGLAKRLG